jgi:alpha-beta hydrolase superfamily lysophospholipase
MNESSLLIDADDGAKLFVRVWRPSGDVRAVLQIVHGMAEHSARYGRLAEKLVALGIEVWADDHRGHGHTADEALNDKGRGGLLGHCADHDGFPRVIRDLELIGETIAQAHPEAPLFLLGHSWGSFLAQAAIERSGERFAGCILSGTRGPAGPEIGVGAVMARLIAAIGGRRRYSPLLHALADGSYNTPFKPNRTEFDWISRDEAEVDAYIADPLCGFRCSAAFYRDLTRVLATIHRADEMARIPTALPIFVFAGSADPVGNMGLSPAALVEAYRTLGIRDLEFVLYPQGRHEMLNETNRDEVSAKLVAWLERRIAKAEKRTELDAPMLGGAQ